MEKEEEEVFVVVVEKKAYFHCTTADIFISMYRRQRCANE